MERSRGEKVRLTLNDQHGARGVAAEGGGLERQEGGAVPTWRKALRRRAGGVWGLGGGVPASHATDAVAGVVDGQKQGVLGEGLGPRGEGALGVQAAGLGDGGETAAGEGGAVVGG
jgi:hypothetical protein